MVTLAFDGGAGIGLGHQRRMEAIASALTAMGIASSLEVMSESTSLIRGTSLVVDSYRWRADDEAIFGAEHITAIDDLRRDLRVGLVVDPAPGANAAEHPSAATVRAGADYAIVDPQLSALATRRVGRDVREVLVATGAGDTEGYGLAIAGSLRAVLPPAVGVSLALGPWSRGGAPEGVDPIRLTDGLAPRLAQADLVVTAAGVTLLEALCLGRPTVGVVLYPNQQRQADGAARAGAALVAAPDDVPEAVVDLVGDGAFRRRLSLAASQLIDGRGARRVAEAIVANR